MDLTRGDSGAAAETAGGGSIFCPVSRLVSPQSSLGGKEAKGPFDEGAIIRNMTHCGPSLPGEFLNTPGRQLGPLTNLGPPA